MSSSNTPKKSRKQSLPSGMVKRGRKYHADFMKNGRRIRKPLSSDLAAAKEMLNELLSRADKSDFDMIDNHYPWSDLRKAFMAWAKQHVRDWDQYDHSLRQLENFTPINNVSQVNARLIDQFRTWRLDQGVTPRTVNREVGTISNMLTKGVSRFKVIASNPIAEVKPLPQSEPTKVRRSLSAEEVQAIFDNSPPDLLPVFRMFATTGLRRNELVSLRFEDIDWELQTLTVRASVAKSKRSREIPLDDTTMATLIELREQAADRQPQPGLTPQQTEQQLRAFSREHVFVGCANTPHKNNLLRRFYKVCKKAGITDAKIGGAVDLHSLRVTFATMVLDGGANPKAVQAILGHSTLDMTMRVYARATDRAKRDTINALPFAKSSSPRHVLTIDSTKAEQAADLSRFSHNSENVSIANVG